MKILKIRFGIALIVFLAVILPVRTPAAEINTNALQAQFFQLCDLAANTVTNENGKRSFFVDSYAVRALCVAYDMRGERKYLDACRDWSERMVKYQEQMVPRGAYYMHYNRKPGETNGDWYSADSSSIGMAVLATSVRCKGAEQKRLVQSVENFAGLVIKNYVRPSGGVSDGLWHESTNEWWCSSGICGSFLFNLYAVTGDKLYLKTALGVTDWLNKWDPTADQPFPLSQQGPSMIFYVMENYSAGRPYVAKDKTADAARAKINWCLDWIAQQQSKPPADRQWSLTKGWGMKSGGLPFHQYVFSRYLPAGEKLLSDGDAELERLTAIEFAGEPKFTQLTAFLMMSCAERLDPEAIYKSGN